MSCPANLSTTHANTQAQAHARARAANNQAYTNNQAYNQARAQSHTRAHAHSHSHVRAQSYAELAPLRTTATLRNSGTFRLFSFPSRLKMEETEVRRPSAEEQDLYYFGLPSQPKLVARSSTAAWEKLVDRTDPFWPSMRTKSLSPPGRHPLAPLWNDTNGTLRKDIIKALAAVEWHAIDVACLGYDSLNGEEPEGPQPITLFVSVEPATVAWEEGHRIVMQCKAILERHGISDIDCEMKESKFYRAADSLQLRAPSNLGVNRPVIDADTHTSECIGVPIADSDREYSAGTKSLYLRNNNKGAAEKGAAAYALTCRHVVFDIKTDHRDAYSFDGSQPKVMMIQSDSTKIKQHHVTLKGIADAAKTTLRRQKPDSERFVLLENLQRQYQRDADRLGNMEASTDARIIGHVVFAPPFQVRPLGLPYLPDRHNAYCTDYALIELYQSKHETPLADITNEVFVGDQWGTKLEQAYAMGPAFRGQEIPSTTTIRLRGTISPEEMYNPPLFDRGDSSTILVAKVGGRSGLTLGFSSIFKSVKREIIDGEEMDTEEWAIVGVRRNKELTRTPFSTAGDSGACVFDPKGRIGGILTGGVGVDGGWDTTYVTPIQYIMNELSEYGFDVSLA